MSPRADAVRNRAKVLAAAAEIFAAEGVAVSTEQVARAAGVGVGTVFRHFPTKEDLLRAVLEAHFDSLVADAEKTAAADDPGEAVFAFLRRAVEQSRVKTVYADAGLGLDALAEAGRSRFREAVTDLLVRAQRAGAVRADLTTTQLLAVLAGAVHADRYADGDETPSMVVFDGLRPR
ncbi:TetR/AcrR family transcriptional regulator [Nocardia sp. NBC_00416]|uniref:TetR/AcrR family transcriptional regulator n=1 Tax=Nocardia sp. NBC_00416 TaxID=2975991 RepID=UPI002E1BB07A